eukprot:m.307357 g.307357  ORF g.307357 m.307357 type:complete len:223 (+) comp42184_c0_seq1:40-708(+)
MLGLSVLLLSLLPFPAESDDKCSLTGAAPMETIGLNFCRRYTDNACCAPPHDYEIEEAFMSLLDTGDSCRILGDVRDHPMGVLYCMPCSPEQPNFVNGTIVYLCQDWVDKAFGSGEDLFATNRLNKCGLLVSSPCLDGDGKVIPDRDRYVCGDDYIIPTKDEYSSVAKFLNETSAGPLGLSADDGYGFMIISGNGTQKCFNAAETTLSSVFVVSALLCSFSF